MDGHLTKYLYYENTGKSQITIPRRFLETENIDWNHNDDLYLVVKEIEGKRVVCIIKKEITCPVCNVPIKWEKTERPNVLKGTCPECGMGFTKMNGNIISDPKIS